MRYALFFGLGFVAGLAAFPFALSKYPEAIWSLFPF